MSEYRRFENETEEELIFRVTNDKANGLIGTWQECADILNKLLGYEYTESKYRKTYAAFKKMFEANKNRIVGDSSVLEEMNEKKRELEQAKIQFRDERNAWNRQNYIAARVNQKLDYLEQKLSEIGRVQFSVTDKSWNELSMPFVDEVRNASDNDLLVMLSDTHFGQTFDSAFGVYNTTVAAERLNKYLSKIVKIQKLHKAENIYVSLCGDLISGSIHRSIQVTNRENVIQQVKVATELISSFCYELTKIAKSVYFTSVSGNHSRLESDKNLALHDERLDDLVSWAVGNSLSHIENFHMVDDNLDTGISQLTIRGNKYISVHGDYDSMSKSSIASLIMMIGYKPYAVCMGHRHYPAFSDESGIRVVQGGSLAGSGDSHTIEKRLSGKPSQTVCVCNSDGIECVYPVML